MPNSSLSRRLACAGLLVGAAFGLAAHASAQPAVARSVGAFEAVALRAPVDLVLRQAARTAVEVRADDAVQPLIVTEVVDGARGPTLEIRLQPGARLPFAATVRVSVDVVNLRALAVEGSGDVRGVGLKVADLDVAIAGSGDVHLNDLLADAVTARIAGSGDLELSGRSTRLSATIAGSGDVDASALDATQVAVRISGSGDALVRAASTLDVTIAGSGDVSYVGNPRLTQRIAGSGAVRQR